MLYKGIICNVSFLFLWYSIHALGYSRKDVSVMHLVLDIVCNHKFQWDHVYMDHCILFSIHANIEVEVFDVHAHVLVFKATDDTVYMQFCCC